MNTKTNKFLLELFNVPETTVASDLTLANSDILSWTLDSVELIKSEYVAKISVTMKEFVDTDFLDGNVDLSAANHEVLGTDLYIHELKGTPVSLNNGEAMTALNETDIKTIDKGFVDDPLLKKCRRQDDLELLDYLPKSN